MPEKSLNIEETAHIWGTQGDNKVQKTYVRRHFMNREKYRVWLISLVLAAILFGIGYYFFMGREERVITDGTLVYQTQPCDRGKIAL